MRRHPKARVACRVNTGTALLEAVRAHAGIAIWPTGEQALANCLRMIDVARRFQAAGEDERVILVLDKATEVGHHTLSGAVMNPKAIGELVPDFLDQGFPVHHEVNWDAMYWMTPKRKLASPVTPPNFANHGNLVISLNQVVTWLAEQAAAREIEVYPGFPAAELLFDGNRVCGVRIQDRGIDKDGKPKGVFEAGPEI